MKRRDSVGSILGIRDTYKPPPPPTKRRADAVADRQRAALHARLKRQFGQMYRRLGGPSNLKGSARWNWVARHFILQQPEFNTPPRKRGRPRGSINPLKDDLKILDEVYDLALGARLTFDQALRQVIRQHEGKGTLSRDAERTTAPKRIRRLAKNIALQSALQNRQNYGVAVLPPFEELFGDKKEK